MPSLKKAVATVHQDRVWWRKILIGGALWLTAVGYPLVEGYQLESIENTQNGFPVPLPRWNDPGGKMLQGFFALMIDFFFFVFPILGGGLLLLCGALGLGLAGTAPGMLRWFGNGISVLVLVWWSCAWLCSVSPVGKRMLISESQMGQALSGKVVRNVLDPDARSIYFAARIRSLPLYLVPIALMIAVRQSVDWSGWLALVLLWLALAALLYARLVTLQLYAAAAREIQQRRFEAFRARTRA